MTRTDFFVEFAQERHRFEVLVAAMLVGYPLSFLARIVEMQHRRHRIDAEAVDVIAIEPEQRVRNEIVDDLGAPEVEDRRRPVRMQALTRIRVLV